MFDLLVKGGTILDPAEQIHGLGDVAVLNGKIAIVAKDIEPDEAKRVIHASGDLVTPGLIDIHAHVGAGLFRNSADPDDAGVLSGVTTLCDAGSAGYATIRGIIRYVLPSIHTDLFCYLHMSSTGLAVIPEIWCWENIHTEKILETIRENRNLIKGIKIRAEGSLIRTLGVKSIEVAKQVALQAKLPLMVHVGARPDDCPSEKIVQDFTRDILNLLEKGDILTHVYTWKPGYIINSDGGTSPELMEAINRGVLLDPSPAQDNWSFETARNAIKAGIMPTTIGTDISLRSLNGPVFSLAVTMSKFMAAGLNLEQVIEMTTIAPARVLGEESNRGSLKVGKLADISIIELKKGEYWFDTGLPGQSVMGEHLLAPKLTIKAGNVIETKPRFKQAVNKP